MRFKVLRIFTLLFLLGLHTSLSIADDGAFDGDGANVYPIKNSDIQMVSETILMRFDENKLRWFVDVTMNFHNHGPETAIQMGFPFTEPYSPDGDEGDGVSGQKKKGPAYNFRSYVNGTEVKTTTKKGTLNPKLPNDLFTQVMTFVVRFDVGEDKVIRHTYQIGGESSSDRTQIVKYILRTGALWRGVIESCQIKVEMPEKAAQRFHIVSPKEHQAIRNEGVIELTWDFKNLKPYFDIRLERLPDYVMELSNEKLMEQLKTFFSQFHDSEYIRYFRNRTYARYGRKFENPYVMSQFVDLPGQDGKTKFSPARLSSSDKEFIQFLNFIEREEATAAQK